MNGSWIKIALAVSLAVNLFMIGAVAGAAFQRHRTGEMRAGAVPGNPLMRVGERLPEAERQAFRTQMRQAGLANRPLLETNRAARDKVAEVFAAPTFDAAAASAALAASREAETAARTELENAVVTFAKGLNADDRRILAEGLRRPPGRGGRGGHGGGPGGGPGGFRGDGPDRPGGPPQ
jgi:uncharacterized membrane protein